MYVEIDNDTALNLLIDRVEQWTEDGDVIQLYTEMYENMIDGGCFDGGQFDVMGIVDNDYINYCEVIRDTDEYYEEIKQYYEENGLGDCSCEIDGISSIEAEYNGIFLIRW